MVDSSGDQSSEKNPAAKTVIHNGKVYYVHPLYTNYAASADGYIINLKRMIPRKGRLRNDGYFDTSVYKDGNCKKMLSSRFIYKVFNGIIPPNMQIDHISGNKEDNSIHNLEVVSNEENLKRAGFAKRGKKRKSLQNVPIKCDVFHYHHIYTNYEANKYGKIYNKKLREFLLHAKQILVILILQLEV